MEKESQWRLNDGQAYVIRKTRFRNRRHKLEFPWKLHSLSADSEIVIND